MKTSILRTATAVGVALTAMTCGLAHDRAIAPVDPLDAAIAHAAQRVEAAHAAMNARPLIGPSHLPKFDAVAAVDREETEWRRLLSRRSRTVSADDRAATTDP